MQPKSLAFAPALDNWRPWSPDEVFARLSSARARWCIAAGWAIDLFLQDDPREHEDIEIAVPANQFGEIASALAGCDFFVIDSGMATPLELASDDLMRRSHQTWVRDRVSGDWRLDIFREPSSNCRWVARRDSRITLDYDELIQIDPRGIPFACPEVVLLFKAKAMRTKDELDFERVLARMNSARRQWLAEALRLVHPGHAWIARLDAGSSPA